MRFVLRAKSGTLDLINNKYCALVDLIGQTRGVASISSVVTGGFDGDVVMNASTQPRLLTLDLRVKEGANVELAKREILSIAKLKQNATIEWEQDGRIVVINGIVESIEMPRFTNAVVMQINLHCEQPYWEDIEFVVDQISAVVDMLHYTTNQTDLMAFPVDGIPFGVFETSRTKTFTNFGDVEVGIQIEITALDTVTNPIVYDTDGNFFGIGYDARPLVMQAGDHLVVTTHRGNKTVKLNGVSIFDKIKRSSTWLQMQTGENQFTVESDDENIANMTFSIRYKQRYI